MYVNMLLVLQLLVAYEIAFNFMHYDNIIIGYYISVSSVIVNEIFGDLACLACT